MRIILLAAILSFAQAKPQQMKIDVGVDLQKIENEPKFNMTSKSSETNQEFSETPKEPKYFGNETQQTISEASLHWLNKTAMKIVWPDKREDILFLTVSQQFSEMTDACIFEGSPGNVTSNSFSAAVVGCMDSDETIVNLGLKDKVLELLLLKNGTTLQETWIASDYDKNLHLSRTKRQTQGKRIATGGSLESNQPSADRSGLTEEDLKIPKSIKFPLDLGYDKKLYNYFKSSHSATKRFIREIVAIAGPFFKPPYSTNAGLPTISWATSDIKEIYTDTNADKFCYEGNGYKVEGSTPLMLFVEDLHDEGKQTDGCARMRAACGDKTGGALAVVDMTWKGDTETQHVQYMARTMAHEFGHMLGMDHDQDHAETRGCNGRGLMSYGKRPDAWSTCSVSDFQKWWRSRGFACKEITKDYESSVSELSYTFKSTRTDKFSENEKEEVRSAVQKFNRDLINCVSIIERSPKTINYNFNYVEIEKGRSCSSHIGGPPQYSKNQGKLYMSLGPGCFSESVIVHQFMHTLGIQHEHSRIDRDNFVTIHEENIAHYNLHNFEKKNFHVFGLPYDGLSIMHYTSDAYSSDRGNPRKPTITSKMPDVPTHDLGTSKWLTNLDIQRVKRMYNCN